MTSEKLAKCASRSLVANRDFEEKAQGLLTIRTSEHIRKNVQEKQLYILRLARPRLQLSSLWLSCPENRSWALERDLIPSVYQYRSYLTNKMILFGGKLVSW